ncbi:hypothetical protein CS0771_07480 [Catellatospora sp. IY07-71]|uniref:hypothetical protein n=1 Tax=Catellatospora sp. IY07-71 TaxID=2728827 RepID=UPI001BB42CFD|nr:hypothetical protein [Catellatospora sp. IY07-71]BCJ71204.1 hypothetical protein CS0771_07480 [Catellatospora sp. IY07-71]
MALAAFLSVVLLGLGAACSGNAAPTAAPSGAPPLPTSAAPTIASPTPSPTPPTPPALTVSFICDGATYTISLDAKGAPVFAEVWAAKIEYCGTSSYSGNADLVRSSTNLSPVEASAQKLLDPDLTDLSDLYFACATIYPGGDYAGSAEMALASANEIRAALILCPKHPRASQWKLVAAGKIFSDGTYLVGKEIKPGTYVIQLGADEGTIHDCYWERTNKSGNIIDNNFILSAKRAQVTIRSSDYSFHSKDCGTWRPR